jgi:hypothetical protein
MSVSLALLNQAERVGRVAPRSPPAGLPRTERRARIDAPYLPGSWPGGVVRAGLRLILLAGMALWLGGSTDRTIAATAQRTRAKKAPGAEFFNEPSLRVFNIELSDAAWQQLRTAPRSYVAGTIKDGDRVLTNVGLHLRGNGSFRDLDEKPSFAIKFDQFTAGQTYRGLTKVMFNNSAQDPTYFAEFVARRLFRDAGLPGARVTHAQVQLNGRDLGLYVVIEAVNKEFLKQHFSSATGNLYEAYLTDIDVRLEQDNGERGDQSDLRKLCQVCALTNATERWRRLPDVLDVDRFVSFAAMEMLTAHWDGYVMHTNNYRIYHDPKTDRFEFIPHGMDWAFLRPTLSIEAPHKSMVGRALLDTPEGLKLYHERVSSLFSTVFRVPVITNRIEQELAKIQRGHLEVNEMALAGRGAALMSERVRTRAAQAAGELGGIPPTPLKFDPNGSAVVSNWRADHDGATAAVDRVVFDGRPTLHIAAAGPHTHSSWRALAYLPRGAYRFEGALRIAARGSVVAMLRISGPSSVPTFGSAPDWLPVTYDFEVKDSGIDIEFVCDFSGAEGEAWFDLNSLRVRRVPP